MTKPTINTINTYLQRPSTHQQPITSTTAREEDEAGIDRSWSLPSSFRKTALSDWLANANGDFHVRATLTGDVPISRGF